MGRKTAKVDSASSKRSNTKSQGIVEAPIIIRDTREQKEGGRWTFQNMVERTVKTGDYTIEGYEDIFTIERKGSSSEFAANLFQDRFERELDRMDDMKYPFVLLEFTMAEIADFPVGSGIPEWKWKDLKVSNKLFMKKFVEAQMRHKAHFILCGSNGQFVARSLFKRILECKI